LEVSCELVEKFSPCFAGAKLSDQESTAVVLELLSRVNDHFKDELINIDYEHDAGLGVGNGSISSLVKLGDVRASLIAILRRNGKMFGFLELQQAGSKRAWTEQDRGAVEEALPKLGIHL
jgi:hypothetical protein